MVTISPNLKDIFIHSVQHKTVFGTYEWAKHNANFIDGCEHDCKYCYSKEMAIRFRRKTPDNWQNEVIRKKTYKKDFKKMDGTVMFPSSHDIHPNHLDETIYYLEKILHCGNTVLIVTKPHLICIQEICNKFSLYKKNILFRFTIGSSNNETLKFWEPGAPVFEERLESIKWAFSNGYKTSISCEPMLDDNIEDVIIKTTDYVTDYIWLGKINFLLRRLKMNGINDKESIDRAFMLLEDQSDSKIQKLYDNLKQCPKLKWKESIKKIVGLSVSTEKGLDI